MKPVWCVWYDLVTITSRSVWTVDRLLSWDAAAENSSDITGLGHDITGPGHDITGPGHDITGLGGASDLISPRPAPPSETPGIPLRDGQRFATMWGC